LRRMHTVYYIPALNRLIQTLCRHQWLSRILLLRIQLLLNERRDSRSTQAHILRLSEEPQGFSAATWEQQLLAAQRALNRCVGGVDFDHATTATSVEFP